MSKIQIRTTKKVGAAPLYMRMKIDDKAVWVNLMLNVDIEKWNAVESSEKKISNLLDKMGHS